MYQRFLALMAAPVFLEDAEKSRVSKMLNTILWASLICILLFSLVIPFVYQSPGRILIIAVVMFFIITGNLFLLHRSYVRLTV
jgi:hypothetical protein